MKIEYKRDFKNKEVIMRDEVFDYLMFMYHNYRKQEEILDKIKEVIKKDRVYIAGERNLSHEIEELLEEIE